MKKILIFGASGQLARALEDLLPDAIFLSRFEADLSHPHKISEILEQYAPSAVINAAAYTQVDNAEKEEILANRINAESPAAMAIYCAEKSIPFVHFSTDYVFPGDGENAWNEEDEPAPLNAYGRSKLAGEEAISHIGGKYLIFRTSWLYDSAGKNFCNTILRLSHEREELRIIDDQFGSPTYVPHLAKAALQALQNAGELPQFPSGIYHLCSGGVASWYGFACEIIGRAGQFDPQIKTRNIVPILASEYPLPAKRPHNSRLDCSKAEAILGVKMPLWQDGLQQCLDLKYSV